MVQSSNKPNESSRIIAECITSKAWTTSKNPEEVEEEEEEEEEEEVKLI